MSGEEFYTLRTYAPGDEEAIQRGFTEVFGVDRSLAQWRWKFLEPPRGARIVLAFDAADELVCQYAAIDLDILWAGAPTRAAQIVDVFSRRRRGLGRRGGAFERTLERFLAGCAAAVDGVAFVYGFPGERHQRAGTVTGHYFEPSAVERLSRQVGSAATAPAWRPARNWISEGFDVHATDRLWQRSRERYPFATVRDAAWFRWRYERRPGGSYLQLGLRRAGELRAWAVVNLDATPESAHWVDLLWDGERAADLAELAAAVEERAAARPAGVEGGGRAVELWLRGDRSAREVLIDRGYSGRLEPLLRLSTITFDPRVRVPEVLERFYLTMGDSDHF
ncbi:MAG: GNAT family N-acetyltransferase [Thermoanaerobaculia bacterium]